MTLLVRRVAALVAFASAACTGPRTGAPAPQASAASATPPVTSAIRPSQAAPSRASRSYTREDLAALADQEAWTELVEHLEDVSPSERDDAWRTLAARAVVAHLRQERKVEQDAVGLARVAEALVRRYPSVRTVKELIALRGELAVAAVGACAARSARWADCDAFLLDTVTALGDGGTAIAAARAATSHGHRAFAMALYRVAVELQPVAVCKSEQALALALDGRSKPEASAFHRDAEAVLARCLQIKNARP